MTNNEYVIKLIKREKELIKICNYHGIYNYDCDDIIQDLYLRLLSLNYTTKYIQNGEPNMFIIFAIIRGLIYQHRKKELKYSNKELFDFEVEDEQSNGKCLMLIFDEIENIDNWFDKNIIDLYVNKKMSIRKIEKETKIGYWFIQPIIHKFKEQVQTSLKSNN